MLLNNSKNFTATASNSKVTLQNASPENGKFFYFLIKELVVACL